MTMVEVEQDILKDLDMLGDSLNRMEYLLGCARAAPGIPENERREDSLVADCQVNTWLMADWKDDVLSLRTDSESALVKGALYLIADIYTGRSRREVEKFTCRLLSCEGFITLFNGDQKRGLQTILSSLKRGDFPESA